MRHFRVNHIIIINLLLLFAFLANSSIQAAPILNDSVKAIADRLEESQVVIDPEVGMWPGEALFTGSIVAGLVDAYELTNNPAYKDAAELGGEYILWRGRLYGFYGDEAYALSRLSEISDNPASNKYRVALKFFYYYVDQLEDGGTPEYIKRYLGTDPSNAVFYVAHHLVAADYIDFYDTEEWRDGLIYWLSKVSDSNSIYPVMAVSNATWALAKTTPLNETIPVSLTQEAPFWEKLVDPDQKGAPYWTGVKLFDLPGMLMDYQVPAGQLNEGSFYWRFAHDVNDANSGYSEDAIFATLGLDAAVNAAKKAKSTPNYFSSAFGAKYKDPNLFSSDQDYALLEAREALLNGITPDGLVFEKLSKKGALYYVVAGEMLQALNAIHVPADLNQDGLLTMADMEIMMDCIEQSNLLGDLNADGEVNTADIDILMSQLN